MILIMHKAQCHMDGGKDTVDDASALNVPALRKMKLNKFPKSTGVVVIDGFGISKCLHDGAAKKRGKCY